MGEVIKLKPLMAGKTVAFLTQVIELEQKDSTYNALIIVRDEQGKKEMQARLNSMLGGKATRIRIQTKDEAWPRQQDSDDYDASPC